jgi:hypothetical protein
MSFFVFVLAGCATAQVASDRWTKPGSRSDDLAVDLYICEQWSRSAEHLRDCMTGHGWKEVASEP